MDLGFKEWTEIIRNIVLVIVSIVGGIWAIFIRKYYQSNLSIKKLEKELKTQAAVNIDIDYNKDIDDRGQSFLNINIKLTNIGNANAFLDHRTEPVSICKIKFRSDGFPDFGKPIKSHDRGPGYIYENIFVLRVNMTMDMNLLYRLPDDKKGIYCIEYKSIIGKSDREIYQDALDLNGVPTHTNNIVWKKTIFANIN